jgi:hypothetical protein
MHAYYQKHGSFNLRDVCACFPEEATPMRERFLRCVSKGYFRCVRAERNRAKQEYEPGPLLCFVLHNVAGQGDANVPHFPFPIPDLCSFFSIKLPDGFYQRLYPTSRVHRESWE